MHRKKSCLTAGTKLGGDLGQNGRPRGRNPALYGTQGEVGVSLKKKKKETLFHSVTIQTQTVVTIYYHCIVFLLLWHSITVVIPLRQFGSRRPLRCYSKITFK